MAFERFENRRKKLYEKMEEGDLFVIFSGCSETPRILPPDKSRSSVNFYYLTGLMEPDLAFMAVKTAGGVSETLFIQAQSAMEEFYMGETRDGNYYRALCGIRDIDFLYNMDSRIGLTAFMDSIHRLYIASENKTILDRPVKEAVFVEKIRNSFPHVEIRDFMYEILCMRMIKDEEEIADIAEAVHTTGDCIQAVMKQIRPGMTEGQVLAICDYTARMKGDSSAIGVVAAGQHANILHYCEEKGVFTDGGMALVDIGIRHNHYTSDITRCFPVNGKFTEEQAHWYRVCLKCQDMIVSKMKPGMGLRECGKEACAYIAEELVKAGFIKEASEMNRMIGEKRKDYVTVVGVNHSIGLVEDETGTGNRFNRLEVGTVYTVEPGIYLGSLGFGIRVEDDYLVTEDGVKCLSSGIPRTVEEIEAFMNDEKCI